MWSTIISDLVLLAVVGYFCWSIRKEIMWFLENYNIEEEEVE